MRTHTHLYGAPLVKQQHLKREGGKGRQVPSSGRAQSQSGGLGALPGAIYQHLRQQQDRRQGRGGREGQRQRPGGGGPPAASLAPAQAGRTSVASTVKRGCGCGCGCSGVPAAAGGVPPAAAAAACCSALAVAAFGVRCARQCVKVTLVPGAAAALTCTCNRQMAGVGGGGGRGGVGRETSGCLRQPHQEAHMPLRVCTTPPPLLPCLLRVLHVRLRWGHLHAVPCLLCVLRGLARDARPRGHPNHTRRDAHAACTTAQTCCPHTRRHTPPFPPPAAFQKMRKGRADVGRRAQAGARRRAHAGGRAQAQAGAPLPRRSRIGTQSPAGHSKWGGGASRVLQGGGAGDGAANMVTAPRGICNKAR